MKDVRTWVWVGLVVGLLGLLGLGGVVIGSASAAAPFNENWCDDFGSRGMMCRGMMGGWDEDCPIFGDADSSLWSRPDVNDAEALDIEAVEETVTAFLADLDEELVLAEVMEFDNHFYAEAVERDTGIGAYELLIDRYTGEVYPEMVPNMMWNEKYGMMGSSDYGMGSMMGRGRQESDYKEMTVTSEEAVEKAHRYLDRHDTGLTPDDEAEPFYGYYTIHVLDDGDIVGMLSVNGYSGRVWYHTWHGDFIRMTGHEEEMSGHVEDMPSKQPATYTDISADQLADLLKQKNFTLINVHIPYEGEIRQTDLFIPFDEIEQNLDLLPADKDAKIVLYCRSGSMSATAAQELAELGYSKVYNLTTGMREWQAAGYDLLTIVD